MGYACPVCEDPQADGEHLANHLAFTAMLGDAGHEDWLDEHAPDWGGTDPTELADRVTELADEREFPQVFEDTTGDEHAHGGHGHGQSGHTHGGVADPADLFEEREGERSESADGASGATASDESERDPTDVLAEARELTEQRRTNAGDDAEGTGIDDTDTDEE